MKVEHSNKSQQIRIDDLQDGETFLTNTNSKGEAKVHMICDMADIMENGDEDNDVCTVRLDTGRIVRYLGEKLVTQVYYKAVPEEEVAG